MSRPLGEANQGCSVESLSTQQISFWKHQAKAPLARSPTGERFVRMAPCGPLNFFQTVPRPKPCLAERLTSQFFADELVIRRGWCLHGCAAAGYDPTPR